MSWHFRIRVATLVLILIILISAPFLLKPALAAEKGALLQYNPTQTEQPTKQDTAAVQTTPTVTMLTVNECIDIALRRNPSILAVMYGVDVSKSLVGQARSVYYPQLSASATYDRVQPTSSSTATTQYNQYEGSVSLNQYITDFGKTSSQVEISKYNFDAARSNLTETQDTVILSVKQAYYGVLQAKRNRDVDMDVIKQMQLHLDQAKAFYAVGTNARIDVINAEVNLSNAQLSLINAENALKIAWVTLNNAMGTPDPPEYTLEDNLAFQKYTITLEEATSRAFENRPDLKSIIAQRQAAEENVSFARSGYYPSLSGNANYYSVGETTSSQERGWSAGVVLTIPLFNGFLTQQQVAGAKSNLYVLRANEETLRNQILLDVRQAYLNLVAAEASISTADLAAKQAKENLDLANGRYVAGVGSTIEVSDAFALYVTAQANLTNALANYKTSQASIEKAMGAR